MKIVTIIKPFNMVFPIYVYDKENLIEEKSSGMNSIADDIVALANKYQINQIDIAGPKKFNQKIQEVIEQKGLAQYNLTYHINLI